jgi:hypothetical protein
LLRKFKTKEEFIEKTIIFSLLLSMYKLHADFKLISKLDSLEDILYFLVKSFKSSINIHGLSFIFIFSALFSTTKESFSE